MIRLLIGKKCNCDESARILERVRQLEDQVARLKKIIKDQADIRGNTACRAYNDELNSGILLLDDQSSSVCNIPACMIKNRREHNAV